ncbi:MAG: NAD(P)-dependent alcohol dehydrogenase [Chloroflexi bacterium]|nr:NAD(P)-dependent alcohol dehydrogenase [Chloroflexota bacterium]
MKAMVCTRYGPPEVLQLQEVEKPVPKGNEVLVKIHATTVTPSDVLLRSGAFPLLIWLPVRIWLGFRKPRNDILGYELSGEIEAIGQDVTLFKAGDPVFGATMQRMSCSAEYICLPEKAALVIKPDNMTFEEAAAFTDGATTAWHFLHRGNIQRGQKVLINGASGSIGTFAVQIAKHLGAEVTGVCSTTNVELVRSLGADQVIDYRQEDFTQNGQTYDVIFDAVSKSSFARCKDSLTENGRYLLTDAGWRHMLLVPWTTLTGGKRVIYFLSTRKKKALLHLKELIEAGHIKSVIDRTYPLEQLPEAHRYVAQGHKKGNVVITITGEHAG